MIPDNIRVPRAEPWGTPLPGMTLCRKKMMLLSEKNHDQEQKGTSLDVPICQPCWLSRVSHIFLCHKEPAHYRIEFLKYLFKL